MDFVLHEPWTVERFLAWEDEQEGRHEFDGTRILKMTGGSRNHQRIVTNLIRLLEDTLAHDRWDAVPGMRLEIPAVPGVPGGGKVLYPDVAVVAGRVPGATKTLRDAAVLFEVVSADTASRDRIEKLSYYAQMPGIRHYVLIEQDRMAATALKRVMGGWAEVELVEGCPDLPELGVVLRLASIYQGVALR